MKLRIGDIVKLNERYLKNYYFGGKRRLKTEQLRFRVYKLLPNNLVRMQRLNFRIQQKETYWEGFLTRVVNQEIATRQDKEMTQEI